MAILLASSASTCLSCQNPLHQSGCPPSIYRAPCTFSDDLSCNESLKPNNSGRNLLFHSTYLKRPEQGQHLVIVHYILEGAGCWDFHRVSPPFGRPSLGMLFQLQQGERGHAVQPSVESLEGCALGQEHQQAVHAPTANARSYPAFWSWSQLNFATGHKCSQSSVFNKWRPCNSSHCMQYTIENIHGTLAGIF